VCSALRRLLADEGFDVEFFTVASGHYRINRDYEGNVCWEAWAQREGARVHLNSDCTMTECAKRGIVVSREDRLDWWVDAATGADRAEVD